LPASRPPGPSSWVLRRAVGCPVLVIKVTVLGAHSAEPARLHCWPALELRPNFSNTNWRLHTQAHRTRPEPLRLLDHGDRFPGEAAPGEWRGAPPSACQLLPAPYSCLDLALAPPAAQLRTPPRAHAPHIAGIPQEGRAPAGARRHRRPAGRTPRVRCRGRQRQA
jgi:hypothetical protein